MDQPSQEWTRIRDGIGDLLLQLITDVSAAEKAIFSGSPKTATLLGLVSTTGSLIAQLETAYAALHVPRPPARTPPRSGPELDSPQGDAGSWRGPPRNGTPNMVRTRASSAPQKTAISATFPMNQLL